MLLIKSFLKKKRTKIYIVILTTLFNVLFLLNSFEIYVNKLYGEEHMRTSTLVMYSKNNHEDVIKNFKGVKDYRRALSFNPGSDSEIIYSPKMEMTENGLEYAESRDESKLVWSNLIREKNTILAFSSNTCENRVTDNRIDLYMATRRYDENLIDEYKGKTINISYNGREISFVLNNVYKMRGIEHVCISDEIYNELIKEEQNYNFEINIKDYKYLETFTNKYHNIDSEKEYMLGEYIYYGNPEDSQQSSILSSMLDIIGTTYFISTIIFFFVTISVIQDLVMSEEKDILLLKQLGFNKYQTLLSSIKNILLLDLITISLAIIINLLLDVIINKIFKLAISFTSIVFFSRVLLFIFLIELLIVFNNKNNYK